MKVRYHGITDEVTECQHCGRRGLKKTIMLFILDADGNADEMTYFGTACAAKALRTTSTKVTNEAMAAQSKRDRERRSRIDFLQGSLAGGVEALRSNWWNWTTPKPFAKEVRDYVEIDGVRYGPGVDYASFKDFCVARTAQWKQELEGLLASR